MCCAPIECAAKCPAGEQRYIELPCFVGGYISLYVQYKLNSPVNHPLRGVKRLGYLYEEPPEESTSDDEGFGQNADLDDGQLTAPGMCPPYLQGYIY